MTRRAFVTGASRGIGKAISLALAADGYDIAISARTAGRGETRENTISIHKSDTRPLPGSLEETAELVRGHGVDALPVPMDLTDRNSVHAAAATILDAWGGVDVIVHNGRYIGPGLMDVFFDTPIEAYGKFFEAHTVAPVILTKALLPGMLDRGEGTIVTVTSSSATEIPPAPAGQGGWGHAYAVGKASGHTLIPSLHAEFASRGIRAFNVDPGFVATERNHVVAADLGHDVSKGASPDVIGAAAAWIISSHEADRFAGGIIEAQALARKKQLVPVR